MLKRSKKLERRYLPLIRQFENKRRMRWTFLTLEGIRISGEDNTRENLKCFMDCATRFIKSEYPDGGLDVLEHTKKLRIRELADIQSEGDFMGMGFDGPCTLVRYENMLYVHAHAIVYGGFKDIPSFASRWRIALLSAGLLSPDYDPLHGKHGVSMSQVRNLKGAVKYALKYVAKGVDLTDEQVEVLTRLKYVRSWGMLYGKELTYDMICMDCEAKCYIDFGALPIEPAAHEKLRIKLVLRDPGG